MLIRVVCVSVCVAVVLMGADAAKGDRDKRDWKTVYCDPVKLTEKSGSKGKAASKQEFARAKKQWDDLEKTDAGKAAKVEILKAIDATDLKSLSAANFAKIPMACLLRLPMTGVTKEQAVEVAKLGDEKMMRDMLKELKAADKTAFLTEALNAANKGLIQSNIKTVIGDVLSADVIKKISDAAVTCPYLIGAMGNAALTRDNLKAILAKDCDWSHPIIMKNMKNILNLYKSIKKITTTSDPIITELKKLLPYMDRKSCEGLFTTQRLTEALSDATKMKALKLVDLDDIWILDKCNRNVRQSKTSQCLPVLAKSIRAAFAKNADEAMWPTLGYATAFLNYGTVNVFKKKLTKPCDKIPFYKMFDVRGVALPEPFKGLIAGCVKGDGSIMGAVTDFTKEKDNVPKYAGYVPWSSSAINGIPKAILCDDPNVFDKLSNYAQYGLTDELIEKCDKALAVTKPIPQQESCLPQGKIAKGKKRQERPLAASSKVRAMSKGDAAKFYQNENSRRETEKMPTPDCCNIVNKANEEDTDTLYTAAKSPATAQCFPHAEVASKLKTKDHMEKMKDSRLNIPQQKGTFKELKAAEDKALPEPDLRGLGRVAPRTITAKFLAAQTAEPFVLAEILAPVYDRLPKNATRKMLEIIETALASEEETAPWKALTTEQADQMCMLLAFVKDPDVALKDAEAEVKKKVCEVISRRMETGVDEKCRRLPDLAKVFAFCKTAYGVPAASGKWTAAEVMMMGQLAGQMAEADITGMTKPEFLAALDSFSILTDMSDAAKTGFEKKFKTDVQSDATKLTIENLESAGSAAMFLSKAYLVKIPKAVLTNVAETTVDAACFKDKFGKESANMEFQKSLYTILTTTSASRKKRSTHTFTYEELNLRSDDYLNQVTLKQYQDMPKKEIKPLHGRLGFTYWTDKDKSKGLLKVIKDLVVEETDICKFKVPQLIKTGFLLEHVTTDEMKCLDFKADKDKMTPFCTITVWSADQFKQLATNVKKVPMVPKDMTADQIVQAGSCLCGFTAAEVEVLKPAELKKKLHITVDLYEKCDRAIWTALLKVLTHKDGFGPVKDMDAATISCLGYIMAGLIEAQIKAMGTKVNNVEVDVLMKADPKVLAEMTDEAKLFYDTATANKLGLYAETGSGTGTASPAGTPMISGAVLLLTLLVTLGLY